MSEASRRPGGLTAICILAIALGSIASCCSLWTLGSAALQDRLQQVSHQMAQGSSSPALRREQEAMQDEVNAYSKTILPYTATFAFISLLFSILLLTGGILAMNLKSGGRTLLFAACFLIPPFEIARNVVEGFFSWHLQGVMERYMTRIMELTALEHGGAGAPPAGMMSAAMGVGSTVTFALLAAWVLAKVVYLVITFVYLRKPEIRALYG